MSSITTIAGSDVISTSRTTINNNFSALNSDKIETSYLDTDTALTANSDVKIATQKAVKAYVDSGGNVDASTISKGIVEEATQAEVTAKTATGGTGARLFVNPSTLPTVPSALTLIPLSNIGSSSLASSVVLGSNVVMTVGQVIVPFGITANKISIRRSATGSTSGTYDITMYSEDGQTQIFSVTTADAATAATIYTTALSAVVIPAGVYYIGINPNTDASSNDLLMWTVAAIPFSATAGLPSDISSEPVMQGTVTITAGTPPATITPGSVVEATNSTLVFRLDN